MIDNKHEIKQVKNADYQIILQNLKIMKIKKKYQNVINTIKKKIKKSEKQEIF